MLHHSWQDPACRQAGAGALTGRHTQLDALGLAHAAVATAGGAGSALLALPLAVGAGGDLLEGAHGRAHGGDDLARAAACVAGARGGALLHARVVAGAACLQARDVQLLAARGKSKHRWQTAQPMHHEPPGDCRKYPDFVPLVIVNCDRVHYSFLWHASLERQTCQTAACQPGRAWPSTPGAKDGFVELQLQVVAHVLALAGLAALPPASAPEAAEAAAATEELLENVEGVAEGVAGRAPSTPAHALQTCLAIPARAPSDFLEPGWT